MAAPALMLIGATGFLGRRLQLGLAGTWRVVAACREAKGEDSVALDLAQPDSLARAFDAILPVAVINAGAIADPDECERRPELAQRINVEAVKVLASLCARAKACLVHFSSDLVFDGEKGRYSEDDTARPLSVYGRGKLESEETALGLCPRSVVLRVTNCYGRPLGGRTSYVDQLRASLAAGRSVPGFTDQWRSPTAADQLPEVVRRILAVPDLRGVFHWGGADRATRYEAALIFCRVMGYDERLIHPARAAVERFLAARPRDTSLDSSRLATVLGLAPVGFQEGFTALKPAWG
jgi:dTDP-4-dehydrorhamnose reductase